MSPYVIWPAVTLIAAFMARAIGGRPFWRGAWAVAPTISAYECMRELVCAGWTDAGAGPNYWCVYLNKGENRIVVVPVIADPVTPAALRDLLASLRQAEYIAGRRAVAVFTGFVEFGVLEEAAAEDLTMVRFDVLDQLEDALADSEDAAKARQAAELSALTRAYDPPVPAPLLKLPDGAAGPSGAPGQPILETEMVACFFRDRGGDELLITFANQWMRHDGRAFWADTVSNALGLSVVGFVAKEPCWYPPDDMAALLPAIRKILDGRFAIRVTYGHSQGGYAAIKFSRVLGAQTVLAFSPQYAIDQRIVHDDRVNKFYAGYRHAGMGIEAADTAGAVFVFFDPRDAADARHAAMIAAATPTLTLPVGFVGHASDRGMGDAARFRALLDASRPGALVQMRQFMARHRAVRVERPVLMAMSLAATRPRTAAGILQHYAAAWKPHQICNVCYRLAIAGQAEAAFSPAHQIALAAPPPAACMTLSW